MGLRLRSVVDAQDVRQTLKHNLEAVQQVPQTVITNLSLSLSFQVLNGQLLTNLLNIVTDVVERCNFLLPWQGRPHTHQRPSRTWRLQAWRRNLHVSCTSTGTEA